MDTARSPQSLASVSNGPLLPTPSAETGQPVEKLHRDALSHRTGLPDVISGGEAGPAGERMCEDPWALGLSTHHPSRLCSPCGCYTLVVTIERPATPDLVPSGHCSTRSSRPSGRRSLPAGKPAFASELLLTLPASRRPPSKGRRPVCRLTCVAFGSQACGCGPKRQRRSNPTQRSAVFHCNTAAASVAPPRSRAGTSTRAVSTPMPACLCGVANRFATAPRLGHRAL